jgi:DNA polymerase-1
VKHLLLVDGHSVVYRSFFAFIRRPLRNAKGFNTSAVFGFEHTLRKMLLRLRPEYCCVVFDAPGETFRHQQYAAYKLNRPKTPEELPPQIPYIKELVRARGVVSVERPGVEADDVLATLAWAGAEAGLEVTLATTDKDLLQLVGGPVTVYDPWKDERVGPAGVVERLGVRPEQVRDLLALMGDSSDNIPGVPGIGPKRAKEILVRYGTLDRALESDERVRAHADLARLSRDLATIDLNVPDVPSIKALRVGEPDLAALDALHREMGFGQVGKRDLPETEAQPAAADPGPSRATAVQARRSASRNTNWVAFEYTPGAGLVLCDDGENVLVAPAGDVEGLRVALSGRTAVGLDLKPLFRTLGEPGDCIDVAVEAWLCDPNRGKYDLERVLAIAGVQAGALDSAEERVRLVARAHAALEPQIGALGLGEVASRLEMPLVPVLARMEERGVKVDAALLVELEREFAADATTTRQRVMEGAGTEFNLDSPRQLGEVLFDRLGLKRGRKTKTGYSTDSDVLERLAAANPIAADVLRYRELIKLCRTYLRPLAAAADPHTGRVHARFDQCGTATGRLSMLAPNLQNIPIRTVDGRRIRSAFVAGEGNLLISADYSQIELRVLAHLSEDAELIAAFERGDDVHRWTAAAVLGVEPQEVTPDDRRLAKVINYGLAYGMGERHLAREAGVAPELARQFLDTYLTRFEGVARWRERVVAQAKSDGVVRTISGRIRPVPEVLERNRAIAEAGKRAAVNAPVQGSAADIVKAAMLMVEERMRAAGIAPGMLLQVHDELLLEVPVGRAGEAMVAVREAMVGAWTLRVPLEVEMNHGRSWGDVH